MKAWIQAFRLRTLPLALSCIGMGSFLAVSSHVFRWGIFILCITTTIFLQVLSNLANDYGDFQHGADHSERTGPSRAVQSGAIQPASMRRAVWLFIALSLCSGTALLFVSLGFNWQALIFFLGIGVLSIAAAVTYTMGRKPYGYAGLGDLSVLIFFGFVGVLGSYFLFAGQVSGIYLLPAATCGLFSMAVLNINNIRDMESDRKAGKISIPVRIGRRNAVIYHWVLLACGWACALVYNFLTNASILQYLFVLVLPLFLFNGKEITVRGADRLDPMLKQMAISTLLFVLFFGVSQILGH